MAHTLRAYYVPGRHFRFIASLAVYGQFQNWALFHSQDSACTPLLEETCFVWNKELILFLLLGVFRVGGTR